MNILIAPDKFNESLIAVEVCNAVEEGIRKFNSEVNITKLLLADGEEGSLLTLEDSLNFERIHIDVKNQ